MDHRFSKREYATSCIFTLFFTMLIAASFVDITLCPVLAQHSPINYLKTPSVFHEHFAFFPCHLLDLVLWIYFVLLVLFLLHKYRMYRQAKQHYFLLDYCYFHNAFVCLLVMLVVLKFAPIGSLLPPPHLSPASSPVDQDAATSSSSWRLVVDVLDASDLTSTWWRTIPVPVDIVPIAAAISPTKWISSSSSSLLSAAELPASTTTRAVSLFFLLLGGTMGPIVGAILMWDNALLFHSYDRMVSCYLHLAPAVAQGLVLHAAFVSHRRFVFLQTILRGLFFDAEFVWASWTSLQEWVGKAVLRTSQSAAAAERTQRDWSQLFQERPSSSSSSTSTSIFVSQQALDEGDISFPSLYAKLFLGHLMMFVVWQLCYHTFVEGRRLLSQRRQPQNGSSPFVDDHVTAYTWLMEKPPLGKNGPLYRFVTLFGTGVVPTKILFSVAQCILHALFMCIGAVPVYCSLFGTSTVLRWWGDAVWWGLYGRWVTLLPEAAAVADDSSRSIKWVEIVPSAQPVLWYTLAFTALCIYNAAKMNKKWIKKLQSGYVEKTRTSPVVTSEAEEGVPKSASKKQKKSQ